MKKSIWMLGCAMVGVLAACSSDSAFKPADPALVAAADAAVITESEPVSAQIQQQFARELRILNDLEAQELPVFVDTNISLETLTRITDPKHVLIMLADPEISVRRFFERPDKEKQFLYRLMLEEPDPELALANFRECLKRINSPERYKRFLHSGFPVILRDENRSVEQTLALVEEIFSLTPGVISP